MLSVKPLCKRTELNLCIETHRRRGKESRPLAFLQRGYPTYVQALSGTPKKAPKFSIAIGWNMWPDDKL